VSDHTKPPGRFPAPKSPPIRREIPKPKAPPTFSDCVEREGLRDVGFVTDGTAGPWGQRIIAIYRTLHAAALAMDGVCTMPEELAPDAVLFQQVKVAIDGAIYAAGKLVLNHLVLVEQPSREDEAQP
jgi:hypothetical protein